MEVVFDFDCTLTEKHLFHTIRSGDPFLKALLQTNMTEWDEISKQLVSAIQESEEQLAVADFADFRYDELFARSFSEQFKGARDFSRWIMGGDARIAKLSWLLSQDARFYISTKGLVSEVKELLHNCCLLKFFTSIDGFDDQLEERVVYLVQKNQYALRSFPDKTQFILSLGTINAKIIYVDDDNEYYPALRHCHVTCLDIGPKESVGAFSPNHMQKLICLIQGAFDDSSRKRKSCEGECIKNK